MIRKLERDRVRADLVDLDALLRRIPISSVTMRAAYESRKLELEQQLTALDRDTDTTAQAAIFFGGNRVHGSESIDAEFAADSLRAFQGLVTAKALREEGARLGRRGPLPSRDSLRLNIVGTARGSFGFILEENTELGKPLFASALKQAISEATDVIATFSAPDDSDFNIFLENIDPRVIVSTKGFFKILREAEATVRIVEGDREESLDQAAVARAYDRAVRSEVTEEEIEVWGSLIGLTPVSGWFEFRADGHALPIRGKTGPQLSRDFLERIEKDGLSIGGQRRWKASLSKKIVVRPTGETKESFTLNNLIVDPQRSS